MSFPKPKTQNPKLKTPPSAAAPLSLYIHIPWCVRKCPYCDFNSHQAGGALPEAQYVEALLADLKADLPYVQGRKLGTLFFGGGTPSLFSAQAIENILAAAERHIGFAPGVEITLEANPGTVEQQKFRDYRTVGVNRLSIGIQSFNARHLQTLGRIHGREEAMTAVAAAREAGFDNLNLDLMHGLPQQTPDEALADLRQAVAWAPTHLSWYQLTIEPNTAFYRAPPPLPEEDVLDGIQQAGVHYLADQGFVQYEVSAYAQAGCASLHNCNYWEFGDYLGIGAGAHGKISLPQQGRIIRTHKIRQPKGYLLPGGVTRDNPRTAGCRAIAPAELPLEFMMNALRLNQGVPLAVFTARTGLPFATIASVWAGLCDDGLVYPAQHRLACTPLGLRFLNQVLGRFQADGPSKVLS